MVKLVKKAKKRDYSDLMQEFLNINSAVMRVLKFLITVTVCVHIMGCFWFYAAKIYNFGPKTWVYELEL